MTGVASSRYCRFASSAPVDRRFGGRMKLKIILAIAALLAITGTAFAQAVATPAVASNSASASSWLAGAQAGYNWQQGVWVYGLEADISATHLNSQANTVLPGIFAVPANVNADIDWYGTVRGRVGWSSGPFLLYGTGGLAYGHVSLSSSLSAFPPPLFLSAQTSAVRTGWVAGGGISYLWQPNVIVSLDYQYVDLGTVNLASSATSGGAGFSTQSASTNGFRR